MTKHTVFRLKEVSLSDIQQLKKKAGLKNDSDAVRYALRLALASDTPHGETVQQVMADIELEQLDIERAALAKKKKPSA